MGRRRFTIVTGSMYVWVEGHDKLPEAMQHTVARDVAIALNQGRNLVELNGELKELHGVALGQGARGEVPPVRLHVDPYGYPIAVVKCVSTIARVQGVPCYFGYLNDSVKYSRQWVVIIGEPEYWRWSLGLPPIKHLQPAIVRFCSGAGARGLRDRIYKEVMSL